MKEEAAKRHYELVVTDAQGQTSRQVSRGRGSRRPEGEPDRACAPRIRGARPGAPGGQSVEVPVILVDREAEGTPGEDYVTFLGSNFVSRANVPASGSRKRPVGRPGSSSSVGTPGSSVAIDRAKGFRDAVAKYPEMQSSPRRRAISRGPSGKV